MNHSPPMHFSEQVSHGLVVLVVVVVVVVVLVVVVVAQNVVPTSPVTVPLYPGSEQPQYEQFVPLKSQPVPFQHQ